MGLIPCHLWPGRQAWIRHSGDEGTSSHISDRDVEVHELQSPLGDVPGGLIVVYDVTQGTGGHDNDGVAINVVTELALGNEHSVEQLLVLRVVGFGVGEELTDEVDRSLDLEDMALLMLDHQSYTYCAHGGSNIME